MKRINGLAAAVIAVCVTCAIVEVYRIRIVADAQESKRTSLNATGKNDPAAADAADDVPYPIFFVDEVLEKLTKAAAEMIEKDLAKTSDALRETLHRTEFSMTLAPPSDKVLTNQELYRKASESVFLVAGLTRPDEEVSDHWQTAFSTAFAIHEDGILSTSAHVFDHDEHDHAVVALDLQGNVHPILEILAADRDADTCLFRIDAKNLKPLALGKNALPGTPIHIMGHPGDSFYFFSDGIIANYERDSDDLVWMNVTADFGQGSSGGPVLDSGGNVIGQVSRTYTLYAGESASASARKHRLRTAHQRTDADHTGEKPGKKNDKRGEKSDKGDEKKTESDDKMEKDVQPALLPEERREADPQMTFKSCTPVSAIRALVK